MQKKIIMASLAALCLMVLVSSCASIPKGVKPVSGFELDRYALVAGKSLDYLWILSREKTIPEDIKAKYLEIAQEAGYDTSRLIWVVHDKTNPV